ncbi:MAG: hypothetical protein R2705_21075 [Ilumatobacteraceae bacterium]
MLSLSTSPPSSSSGSAPVLDRSGLGAGRASCSPPRHPTAAATPSRECGSVLEATWVVLGVALGGPIGVGTVIVALLIGPAVAFGSRTVESLVTVSRRQLDLATA